MCLPFKSFFDPFSFLILVRDKAQITFGQHLTYYVHIIYKINNQLCEFHRHDQLLVLSNRYDQLQSANPYLSQKYRHFIEYKSN